MDFELFISTTIYIWRFYLIEFKIFAIDLKNIFKKIKDIYFSINVDIYNSSEDSS